jgi:hypothetical protein
MIESSGSTIDPYYVMGICVSICHFMLTISLIIGPYIATERIYLFLCIVVSTFVLIQWHIYDDCLISRLEHVLYNAPIHENRARSPIVSYITDKIETFMTHNQFEVLCQYFLTWNISYAAYRLV